MLFVWVLHRGNNGDGCDLASTSKSPLLFIVSNDCLGLNIGNSILITYGLLPACI